MKAAWSRGKYHRPWSRDYILIQVLPTIATCLWGTHFPPLSLHSLSRTKKGHTVTVVSTQPPQQNPLGSSCHILMSRKLNKDPWGDFFFFFNSPDVKPGLRMSGPVSSLSSNILGQGLQIQMLSEPTRSCKWMKPGSTWSRPDHYFHRGAGGGELDWGSRAAKYFIIQEKLDIGCVCKHACAHRQNLQNLKW